MQCPLSKTITFLERKHPQYLKCCYSFSCGCNKRVGTTKTDNVIGKLITPTL